MSAIWLAFIAYILGVLLSVTVPYVLEWLGSQKPFDWRYLIGRVLGAIGFLVPVFASPDFWDKLANLAGGLSSLALFFYALALGYGASQIGRIVQKAGGHPKR